jgi:hypothetical protein
MSSHVPLPSRLLQGDFMSDCGKQNALIARAHDADDPMRIEDIVDKDLLDFVAPNDETVMKSRHSYRKVDQSRTNQQRLRNEQPDMSAVDSNPLQLYIRYFSTKESSISFFNINDSTDTPAKTVRNNDKTQKEGRKIDGTIIRKGPFSLTTNASRVSTKSIPQSVYLSSTEAEHGVFEDINVLLLRFFKKRADVFVDCRHVDPHMACGSTTLYHDQT